MPKFFSELERSYINLRFRMSFTENVTTNFRIRENGAVITVCLLGNANELFMASYLLS